MNMAKKRAIYIIFQTINDKKRGMYMETTNTNILHDRAYALYRVSSLGQVEKDDIPMQKQTRKSCGRLRVMTFPRCGRSAKENVLSTEGKADI